MSFAPPSTRKGPPVGVAVIGAGNISKQYLDNLTVFPPDLKVLVIADLFVETAEARAKEYGIAEFGTPELALNHPDVELIINLTIPAAHVEVATAAVNAGKHVWTEKPFSLDRESGLGLLKAADAAGIRLGTAPPDTFLGAGLQTARRIIERGDIGTPPLTGMTTFQTPPGPESWHPNPAFLFQHGAGPLFDMGPYYLTALIQTFGSVRKVAAVGSSAKATRIIGSGPKAGEEFAVEVPTHVSAMAQFEGGQSSHSVFSFESPPPTHGIRGNHRLRSHAVPPGPELLRRRPEALAARCRRTRNHLRHGSGERPWHGSLGHGPRHPNRRPPAPGHR